MYQARLISLPGFPLTAAECKKADHLSLSFFDQLSGTNQSCFQQRGWQPWVAIPVLESKGTL